MGWYLLYVPTIPSLPEHTRKQEAAGGEDGYSGTVGKLIVVQRRSAKSMEHIVYVVGTFWAVATYLTGKAFGLT